MENNEKKNVSKTVKNSLVLSGLVGTAGLFIAKLLGLIYSIPLSSILASDALMNYYGTSYQIYAYILNVFTAGIPFAISTLVAKYTVFNDNKSLLTIKKLSMRLLGIMGISGMILLILISGVIANIVAGPGDHQVMSTCMIILSLAIFVVPILSSYRGFWQGRKEMGEYAFTQTFEQIVRVGFLLSTAYLVVYVFNMERKYALYLAVLSTSVAAIAAIIQIFIFDKKHIKEITDGANVQESDGVDSKKLFHELLILAIPYLLTAVIGYCDSLFNSILLPIGLRLHGYGTEDYYVISSAVNYVDSKLTSIPQILAPAFVAALIPHITEARTVNDQERIRKITTECIGIVFFIGSVVSACIAIYATDIFNILFYTSNVELSSAVTRWSAIDGFLGTICPITSSLMIALGLRKSVLKRQLFSAVLKGIIIIPLVYLIGFRGAVGSSIIGNCFVFIGNIREIQKIYNVNFEPLLRNIGKIVVALLVFFATSLLLRYVGLDGNVGGKLIAFVKFVCNVLLSLLVYFGVSQFMKIPQALFEKDLLSLVLSKFRRKAQS